MELVNNVRLLFRVSFVDREEQRTSRLAQQSNQLKVGPGERGAAIHDHDDGGGFIERDARLTKNFRWDEILVFRNDAAGVDDAEIAPAPLGVAIEAVASDAGLVANDGATRTHNAVEQRGLAHVGATDDGEQRR